MLESIEQGRVPGNRVNQSKGIVRAATFWTVVALVGLRAIGESSMMYAHGPDAQMGIWWVFMTVKLGLWTVAGLMVALVVRATWQHAWWRLPALALFLAWTLAIGWATYQYVRGANALAVASNASTSPDRLRKLVHFNGIQAGYELDNRVASHANTPADALQTLFERGNAGTLMCLGRNPHTPAGVLEQLFKSPDEWVRRSLDDNPTLKAAAPGKDKIVPE